jgi:hypothetical protein
VWRVVGPARWKAEPIGGHTEAITESIERLQWFAIDVIPLATG